MAPSENEMNCHSTWFQIGCNCSHLPHPISRNPRTCQPESKAHALIFFLAFYLFFIGILATAATAAATFFHVSQIVAHLIRPIVFSLVRPILLPTPSHPRVYAYIVYICTRTRLCMVFICVCVCVSNSVRFSYVCVRLRLLSTKNGDAKNVLECASLTQWGK